MKTYGFRLGLLTVALLCAISLAACQTKSHVHTFSVQWTADESAHWHQAICKHTDLFSDKENHSFSEWETVTLATVESDGLEKRICSVCEYTQTRTVAKEDVFPTLSTWSSESPFSVVFGNVEIDLYRDVSEKLHLFLPFGDENVKETAIRGNVAGRLSVNGTSYSFGKGETVSADLEKADTVFFDCSGENAFYHVPIEIHNSKNLDALVLEINKPLNTITKDDNTAATGYLTTVSAEGTVTEIGAFTDFLKRGNMSYRNAGGKYSYKFKLDSKTALVKNFDGKDVKSKNWVLVANNIVSQDLTGFANAVGYDNYFFLDGDNAVSYKFVNLYVNGEYQGVYQLAEKATNEAKKNLDVLDEDQTDSATGAPLSDATARFATAKTESGATYSYCSNAVSTKNTGFVMEIEHSKSSDKMGYVITARGKIFAVKDPNYPTKDQMLKLANFIQEFEDALCANNGVNALGKRVGDYVNIKSIAKQYIVYSLQSGGDYWVQSTFLTVDCGKDGNLKKMKAGNVWDMNYMRTDNMVSENTSWTTEVYKPYFMKNGEFVAALYDLIPEFTALLDAEYGRIEALFESMKPAMEMNRVLWGVDFEQAGNTFLDEFKTRIPIWNNAWSNATNALRGVTVAKSGSTLTANAPGATEFQWYRINADGYTGYAVQNATKATFTPGESGTYYVVVKGKALTGTACSNSMYSVPVVID